MADDVTITVHSNGPYHIKGIFRVATQGGRELAVKEGQAWLCRCGHSLNKPFCDGSHKHTEFDSSLNAPVSDVPA